MVSNTAEVHKEQCLGSLMHIDPLYSLAGCKKGVSQQKGPLRLLPFGNDACFIVEVAAAKISYQIANKYAYKISESQDGRDHQSYTAALSNINFQNQTSPEFQDFKSKYQKYKGDYLKTQILEDIKNQIQETSSKTELYELKEKLKNSYEYQVLKTGQGWFTQTFSLDTSSVKAFDKMFKQQEDNLSYTTPKSSV
ncbi:Multifunctional virulence effector protein DrrA [Legionella parisiensis]|uniref:Multifunctional virulence effector protein DrrA n=3 Tax=Legionella parisiensis TaxID=45071 RepID=A0A1E5JRA4_9GAMM|nr:Multifunctional virulence effector protein DrrA [Legionella parisiensis]